VRVVDESEVPNHPADINKTDNGERYALQLAASAIAQKRNQQDQRDRERRHGNKESVPARALFTTARIRNYRGDSDRNDCRINRAAHPRVTMQSQCAREFLESVDRKQRDAHYHCNASANSNDKTDS